MLRSITDDLTVKELLKDPDALVELLRRATEAEPTHSEPTAPDAEVDSPPDEPAEPEQDPEPEEEESDEPQPEADPGEPEGSRATQPPTDYLADNKEEEWRL